MAASFRSLPHPELSLACKRQDPPGQSDRGLCIVSWRVFWMTMLNRAAPDAQVQLALTASEIHLLDHLLTMRPTMRKTLSYYLTKIARLGGYLARASDSPR
jgi:hypothetical protein